MRKKLVYIILLIGGLACKEKYELPYAGPSKGYLVVDGVINSGQGPTAIRLSRTLALVDSVGSRNELRATVRVEGEDNSQYPLMESNGGLYTATQLALNNSVKYRLYIRTTDGKEYVSDYRNVIQTPPIDSVEWVREDGGVQFYINTHDPLNKTLYYRWEYEETWEFHSVYPARLKWIHDPRTLLITKVVPNDADSVPKMFTCWQFAKSTNLLIGSSVKLSRDTIHLPIHFIPEDSWKISVLYSMLLRQFAMSKDGYEFLQRMKKNTEQVGSLFDAQPSELVGNIHCVSNPAEPVIGFIETASMHEKRIFIRRSQVPDWKYRMFCEEISVVNTPDSLNERGYMLPTDVASLSPRGDTLRVNVSDPDCVDCRRRGTNKKPPYWP